MESAPYLEEVSDKQIKVYGDNYYVADDLKVTEINEANANENELKDDAIREQLVKVEEEIVTLRQVLNSKLSLAQDLKRQLGITVIDEMKGDIIQSINSIKDSHTFKAMKNVKEITSNTLYSASSNLSNKLGMIRNSDTFRSIEGKMETAITSVKKSNPDFKAGDKIFAKVKGFVYWPARVNPLPEDIVIPPTKIPIFFYGTHEVFFISPVSCWPYEKKKNMWGKPNPRARFNQALDEIENNPTLFQYGADPEAEEFLSQFYKFKRSNGDISSGTKDDLLNYQSDVDSKKSKKGLIKSRHASGSTFSTKSNKIDYCAQEEVDSCNLSELHNEEDIKVENHFIHSDKLRKCRNKSGSSFATNRSESVCGLKTLTDDNASLKIEGDDRPTVVNKESIIEVPARSTRKSRIPSGSSLNTSVNVNSMNDKDVKEPKNIVPEGNEKKKGRKKKIKGRRTRLSSSINYDNTNVKIDMDKSVKEKEVHDDNIDVKFQIVDSLKGEDVHINNSNEQTKENESMSVTELHNDNSITQTNIDELVKDSEVQCDNFNAKTQIEESINEQGMHFDNTNVQNGIELPQNDKLVYIDNTNTQINESQKINDGLKKKEEKMVAPSNELVISSHLPRLRSRSRSTSNGVKEICDKTKNNTKKVLRTRSSSRTLVDKMDNVDASKETSAQSLIEGNKQDLSKTKETCKESIIGEKLNLRSKSISIDEKSTKRKLSTSKPMGTNTNNVANIDNANELDFQPSKKCAKKVIMKSSKPSTNGPKPKSKVKQTTKVKKCSGSLSSISSIDDQKEKDEHKTLDGKEVVNGNLFKSESQRSSNSLPSAKGDDSSQSIEVNIDKNENIEECQNTFNDSSPIGKEVIVEISITDIGKSDEALAASNNMDICDVMDHVNDDYLITVASSVKDVNLSIESNDLKCEYPAKEEQSRPSTKKVESLRNSEEIIPNKTTAIKSSNKVLKKQKNSNNRKRKRLDSSDSNEEVVNNVNKKMKLSRTIDDDDSDLEMVSVEMPVTKPVTPSAIPKKVPFIDTGSLEPKQDQVKALQTFNSDIRSSLVLGHEDYGKCLDRFRSLCTMNIDLLSLVSVWQLMDTVKKCRRYKRNELVMSEAQNVYKRFLNIYSQSSVDEIHKAQILLAQCKVGGPKTDHAQNPSIPISVAEMFHQHSNTNNNKQTLQTQNKNHNTVNKTPNKTVVDSTEEKMRLLSADLEAKVSDILNKIEKNSVVNRQSMTHLLPSRVEQWVQELPDKWQTSNEDDNNASEMNKDNSDTNNIDSDDDEDDVDAIVKRIENVPISQIEEEADDYIEESANIMNINNTNNQRNTASHHQHIHHRNSAGIGGAPASALDARIENLFNIKFKDATLVNNSSNNATKRHTHTQQSASISRAHNHKPTNATNSNSRHTIAEPSRISPPHKPISSRASIEPTIVATPVLINKPPVTIKTPIESETTPDNSIYDLLGV